MYQQQQKENSFPVGHIRQHWGTYSGTAVPGNYTCICLQLNQGYYRNDENYSQRDASVHIHIRTFTVNLHIGNMTQSQFKKYQSAKQFKQLHC